MRTCSKCGGHKFYTALSKRHSSGLRYRCGTCESRRAQAWAIENPEARRAIARRWNAKKRDEWKRERWLLKLDVFMNLGGSCACCGEGDLRFLTIDHLNQGGAEHRRQVGGNTSKVYADIRKQGYPRDKFQVLCWNCHMALRYGDVCPHKEEPPVAANAK